MHENAFPFLVDKHIKACKMVENSCKRMLFCTPKPIILLGEMRHIASWYDLLWGVKWLKQEGEMAFIGNRCLFVLSAFQKTLLNYHNAPFHLFHGKGFHTCRISRSHVGTHGPCLHSNGPATRLLAHAFSCSALGGGADLASLRGPYPPDFPKPFVDNAQAFKSEKTVQCRLQAAFIRHSVSQQEGPSQPVDI